MFLWGILTVKMEPIVGIRPSAEIYFVFGPPRTTLWWGDEHVSDVDYLSLSHPLSLSLFFCPNRPDGILTLGRNTYRWKCKGLHNLVLCLLPHAFKNMPSLHFSKLFLTSLSSETHSSPLPLALPYRCPSFEHRFVCKTSTSDIGCWPLAFSVVAGSIIYLFSDRGWKLSIMFKRVK